MKFIIGGAQLGQIYGITNKNKTLLSEIEIFRILEYCWKSKIRVIDTAENYGRSLEQIGNYHKNSKNKFKIINKVYGSKNNYSFEKIKSNLINQLNVSNVDYFETIMIHNPEFVPKDLSNKELQSLKDDKISKKIGVSIYSQNDYYLLSKKFNFDVIQLPMNILNQELFSKEFFAELKQKKIEIHARSIFLQGLLIGSTKNFPNNLSKLKRPIKKIQKMAFKNNRSTLSVALQYITENPFIDSSIIGVQSLNELKEILKVIKLIYEKPIKNIDWKNLSFNDHKITNPKNWKI